MANHYLHCLIFLRLFCEGYENELIESLGDAYCGKYEMDHTVPFYFVNKLAYYDGEGTAAYESAISYSYGGDKSLIRNCQLEY